jgi:4-amino-4-deoxy-L-arabinose transferase-like glycosyltransferase
MAAAALLALIHVIATRHYPLIGDEGFYDAQARLFAAGHPFQSVFPLTEVHPTAWKTPGFPAWIGVIYTVFGNSATTLGVIQALVLAPLVVFLSWLLARRLFGPTVGIVAASGVAVMPLIWESYAMLLPEALVMPVALTAMILVLACKPSRSIALWAGLAIGIAVLIRPNSFFLLVGALIAWGMTIGLRRGVGLTAIAAGVAILVILPWSIRNQIVTDGFVPLSVQDAAGYGTFNDEAASDPNRPYGWRATFDNGTQPEIMLHPTSGLTESEIRSNLNTMMVNYIKEHPYSVPEAFFWNGIVRLWDLRTPGSALDVVGFSVHSRAVHLVGLIAQWFLVPFILTGLWRLRRRLSLLAPLLTMLAVLSITCTVDATTRYRLPVEPLLIIVAASTVPIAWRRLDSAGLDEALSETASPARVPAEGHVPTALEAS